MMPARLSIATWSLTFGVVLLGILGWALAVQTSQRSQWTFEDLRKLAFEAWIEREYGSTVTLDRVFDESGSDMITAQSPFGALVLRRSGTVTRHWYRAEVQGEVGHWSTGLSDQRIGKAASRLKGIAETLGVAYLEEDVALLDVLTTAVVADSFRPFGLKMDNVTADVAAWIVAVLCVTGLVAVHRTQRRAVDSDAARAARVARGWRRALAWLWLVVLTVCGWVAIGALVLALIDQHQWLPAGPSLAGALAEFAVIVAMALVATWACCQMLVDLIRLAETSKATDNTDR